MTLVESLRPWKLPERAALVSTRQIMPGDELLYTYTKIISEGTDGEGATAPLRCNCGASCCTGRIFIPLSKEGATHEAGA